MYVCMGYASRRFQEQFVPIDVTNCARDPKPLTHCLTSSPRYRTYKQCFFRLNQTERDRKREKDREKERESQKLVCVVGSLHALSHCGLQTRHGGQKWNWFFFFFDFLKFVLFCFGPPPSGIVRSRWPWTWTSQWLTIKKKKKICL